MGSAAGDASLFLRRRQLIGEQRGLWRDRFHDPPCPGGEDHAGEGEQPPDGDAGLELLVEDEDPANQGDQTVKMRYLSMVRAVLGI